MAVLDNGLKGAVPSILVVLGVALAAPIVLPAVAAVSRPLAKTLIKGYLVLSDMAKEFAAETGEQISDLVAEVKAEREAAVAAGNGPRNQARQITTSGAKDGKRGHQGCACLAGAGASEGCQGEGEPISGQGGPDEARQGAGNTPSRDQGRPPAAS